VDNIPRLLKAFVITGGVALVAGTALLVVLILTRPGGERHAAQREPTTLALPKGARVEQMVADGQRLMLLGAGASGRQFLLVIDPLSGERLSLLWLEPED
jgi:hypothetical protein